MFGGKFNYGKEYAKYRPKQPASIFEQYVDETPDLLAAWNQIEGDPQGTQGSYWIPRGASSKAAFGRAHAAEDSALAGGTYQGGTDVAPWTGGTRFEGFLDLLSNDGTPDIPPGPLGEYTGSNPYYTVMDTQYSAPSGGGLIPDAYATWSDASKAYVPESIWSGAETAPLTGLGYGVEYNAPRFGPITIPVPETEGTSGTSGTTTDASGNKWVITPGGQWISADSDYGQALAAKNAAYSQHYDSSGAYVGSEGTYYDPDTGWEMLPSGVRAPGNFHIKDLDMWAFPHEDKYGNMVKGKMISAEDKLAYQQKAGTFGKNVPGYINTGKTGDAWSYDEDDQ